MGKIAAFFVFNMRGSNAALTQEDLTMTLFCYLQEVAKRRTLPLFLTPILTPN